MVTKIVYDKYDTQIDTAIFKFDKDDNTQEIILKMEEFEAEDIIDTNTGLPLKENKIVITSTDTDGIEIENILGKEDLRTILSVARNLLKQI